MKTISSLYAEFTKEIQSLSSDVHCYHKKNYRGNKIKNIILQFSFFFTVLIFVGISQFCFFATVTIKNIDAVYMSRHGTDKLFSASDLKSEILKIAFVD